MKTYLYLSDIHSNFEALKHLDSLPEMQDPDCEIRFGGDYIDGVDLEPDAVINTLRYVKNLCDSGKAKAILGNHDRFILDATFRPFNETAWWLNGRDDTLANLGLTFRSPSDLREQLLYHYYDELEWLRDLPYYLEDGKNIMVHAGFDLDLSLEEQDEETMTWTRDPYIEGAFSLLHHVELHPDFRGKTIISGHTPTSFINGNLKNVPLTDMPHDLERNYVTRHFIDGGSKSGSTNGRINVLMLDEKGYEIKQGYLDKTGYHNYWKGKSMKYVTLEHKLALTCNPYVNFDTNDSSFETEIYKLRHRYYLEHEDAKDQIRDEINQVVEQAQQIKDKLEELRLKVGTLKRLTSKEYKASRNYLRQQYQDCQIRYLKLRKEIEYLDDNIFKPFDKYHDIKQLLKDHGYALVNKTTNDNKLTTEIWHKND